jgi:hypothetical protein
MEFWRIKDVSTQWTVEGTQLKAEEHKQYSVEMSEMYNVTNGEWRAENRMSWKIDEYGKWEPRTHSNSGEKYLNKNLMTVSTRKGSIFTTLKLHYQWSDACMKLL